VMAAIAGLALVASPQGALDALRFQLERPVHIESLPAMALLALDGAGAGEAVATVSHRSDGLAHEASNALSAAGLAAMLGAVALAAALAYRLPGRRSLVIASLAAVTASAALGKVLSPQFVIWVAPLGALAFAWRMPVLAAAVLAALVLTQLEFPAHYFDVVEREPVALALVATRDLTLLGVLALALRSLALQLSRQEDLLDRRRPAVATGLD
jgi:MFS family permease